MIGDTSQNQTDRELVAWLDSIPISKPTRNLTRDFSDAVLVAEILKVYYPRYVELHNYVPANNLNTKKENWNTLNRKVLAKIDMKLTKDAIHNLASASQGAIKKFLLELRIKILRNDEEAHKMNCKYDLEGRRCRVIVYLYASLIEEKTGDSLDNQFNSSVESSSKLEADPKINEINSSKFARLKRGLFFVFSWIIFPFWILISYFKLPRLGGCRRDALADVGTERIKNVNDETVCREIYSELKQELREKEEIICTLNHKIVYLESSMKLKDLRISSLTTQILQNAVEMDRSVKSSDDARVKLRSRSHNFHESKTN
ncbi:sperm flagellar protein 1 [Camponotus floridanus]|uniref:sperm flagellar protein 1 n=1 Tax=Camponotus floridanus TaxID=104421 RepID=UPI0009715D03|nr:sperm flagellar protein 1 [Camponotus floridanus]